MYMSNVMQALSKALTGMRADMVTQAQDDVKANADQAAMEHNVQKVVQKHTKEYQVKIFKSKYFYYQASEALLILNSYLVTVFSCWVYVNTGTLNRFMVVYRFRIFRFIFK